MKKKHLILLTQLMEKKKEDFSFDSPYNILIHSILNNIELNQLIDYYLKMKNTDLKNSVNSNISKRLITANDSEKIYSNFHSQLECAPYIRRQRIRNILYELLPTLPDIYYEDFFNTFYYSRYSNDKKSAISIFQKVSDKRHHEIILKDYFKSGNEIYLQALIDDNASEILSSKIEEIWDSDPKSYLKRSIILLLQENYLNSLDFLRIKDSKHYHFLKCNMRVFNIKEVLRSFQDIPEKERHFAIFNMSKKVSWNTLEKQILMYLN
ncbi:hypothetical protein SOM12_04775 [Flavobacterium sp. CFBP9031]|jgi:hypothetical protein|uniref:hypothetical protein n=1 Tax=Flavobacterium sp. CFBP9031 TaxID=3096538 RepID=UPI002A69B00F|nr:hypothetical protein [Flavobacterium sp. CFBP9031]MDY0986718.1 hypothetical protein [Flavobacterium sp. CFBP9031]